MQPLVHCPRDFHNFTSVSHWPACRLTSPHLLMTRMMPWVNLKHETEAKSKPLIVRSGQQNFHDKVWLSKNNFSLQNEGSQRNLHRLFAHDAMDWAHPIPAFQRLVPINPHRNGGEINQLFVEIKYQFHQRRDRLAASPPYSRLSTTRLYQFFPWGRRWIQSSLDDIENQFQQLREKLAANPNVLQLVDGDNEVPAEIFNGLCFVCWKISSMLQMPLYIEGCYSNKGMWWTQYLHTQAQQMYFSLWQCWRCSDMKANKQMYRMI